MPAPKVKLATVQSDIRATVSTALAKALILGIDECSENKRDLSQLQQIDLAKMSIMCYDEAIKSCESIGLFAELESRFPFEPLE